MLSRYTSSATKNIPYTSAVIIGHVCGPADVKIETFDVGGPKERSFLSGLPSLGSLIGSVVAGPASGMGVCIMEKSLDMDWYGNGSSKVEEKVSSS